MQFGGVVTTLLSGVILLGLAGGRFSYNTFIQEKEALKEEKCAFYKAFSDREAEWILSLQQENGALFMYEPDEGGEGHVNPYFACQAMLGIISDGESSHIEAVGRYLNWHTDALIKEQGAISDYSVKDGVLLSDGDADSFDSYAAEYLLLLSEYLKMGGDEQAIGDYISAIALLADKFDEVTKNRVTYVNDDFRIAYLMDNAEVYEAADMIGGILTKNDAFSSDPKLKALGERYLALAAMVKESVEKDFWIEEDNAYAIGLDKEGEKFGNPDFSDFYPDAVAQLYPAITGLRTIGKREMELYERVCSEHDWESERIEDTTFEWSLMAYVAALHRDGGSLDSYLEIYEGYTEKNRTYPMHTANAGWIMRSCSKVTENIRNDKDTGFINYLKWLFKNMD